MFYVENILAKKGPLGKIWIAAHWDKKLSKTQIYQTDIPTAVQNVKEPSAPYALRLSGQLLLGVVRIYLRKTKYLLDDCGEAVTKIQIAFVPGHVDLPTEISTAPYTAITLPENFENIDMLLPQPGFAEYTDYVSEIGLEDGLGITEVPTPLLLPTPIAPTTAKVPSSKKTPTTAAELEIEQRRAGKTPGSVSTVSNISLIEPGFGMVEPEPPSLNITHISDQDSYYDHGGDMGGDQGHLPSIFNVIPEALAPAGLVPVIKASKKRKLVIDKDTELSGDDLRLQLQDYTDLLREQEFLPASKKVLRERGEETDDPNALFTRPPLFGLAEDLQGLIQTNMEIQLPQELAETEVARRQEQRISPRDRGGITPITPGLSTTLGGYSPPSITTGGEIPGVWEPPADRDQDYFFPPPSPPPGEQPRRTPSPLELAPPPPTGAEPLEAIQEPTGIRGALSVDTTKVIKALQDRFNQNRRKPLKSQDLFQGENRRTVAGTFFELLVLKSRGLINVEQQEPYGDIQITSQKELFSIA